MIILIFLLMLIAGFHPLSLLDYPEKLSCIVFLSGCNLRCGFCHNPELVLPEKIIQVKTHRIQEKNFFAFLDRRKGILDGVVISGGEPTLRPDLPDFIRKIREKGFLVKLDTNGQNPDMLWLLLSHDLIDMVAMDIKHTWSQYPAITNTPTLDISRYQQSVSLIMTRAKSYEFRSTIIQGVHTQNDIEDMARSIDGAKKYVLQNYRDMTHLDPDFSGSSWSHEELLEFQKQAHLYVERCELRE